MVCRAATPADADEAFRRGEYERVISDATKGVREAPGQSDWPLLLVRALLTVGRNAEADAAMKQALAHDSSSIRLRWLARDVARANNRPEEATTRVSEIRRLVAMRPWNYRDPRDMVIFGRAALLLGADPKEVLDRVYRTAQTAAPKLRDVYLARGELALDKHDFALAAKAFDEGLKQSPDDPDLLCGQSQAYADTDRETAMTALRAALKINPHHVPSLLQLADHHIDAEAYDEAEGVLQQVLAINGMQPDAWAYRAVIAHLHGDAAAELAARAMALSTWATNPRVDYLIGQKLAQKYRFAEAAAAQRRALHADPGNLAASSELATDLLRLGNEAEGWKLAQTVHTRDEYDVEAYNLVTLRDTMASYSTLTEPDFVLRMAAPEMGVYGSRVLALLRRAKQTLTAKYGVELALPTYVEVFADEKDFAVRTFGLPDIPGFLGVCFGRVVTANGPAANATPINWESVLWHEFCHVVTLQLTENKMPRWVSEGISVYEERQANPTWGMKLSPRYREMILGDDLVPVGKLSGAFLSPKTPEHLQFAYLESALVIEYLVDRFGLPALRAVLLDLRRDVDINTALARHTLPMPGLEKGFAAFARDRARRIGAKLDWTKPDPNLLLPGREEALASWESKHPDDYWLLKFRAAAAIEAEKWADARGPLERLVELYPEQPGDDSAYPDLVKVLRALGDEAAEKTTLIRWAAVDDEATEAYLRLMQLDADAKDWAAVRQNAERYLAVNPLVAPPYVHLANACAAAGDVSGAVVAWRTLLQLDPADPSNAHYQLARLLHQRGEDTEAKRQVLLALEDTPRFRAALRLLTDIEQSAHPPAPALQLPSIPMPVTVPKS
jgi:tetratricopeptide (TPR) repeat protein